QTDGEAMINSIKNGDQLLPHVTQVSIVGTTSTEQPPLKDKSMCNKTAKDLWDALARHMLGFEYGEQDRKAGVLYEYETFKATEREFLLDTYIRYLQVINDLKKCGYSKDNYVNDVMGSKKKTVVVTSDPLALIAEKTMLAEVKRKMLFLRILKEVKLMISKAKVKDYEYYKTKMLLAKKDKDEQVLLAKDQAWMESSSDSDQEINANMVFMAQIKKVLFDSKASSSSADEKISEVPYYLSESESKSEFETLEYYDNSTNYGLFVNNDDDQEIFHDAIDSASENFIENHIDSQKDYDNSDVDHNDFEEKDQLVDKLIRKFNKKTVKCQNRIEKANQQSKDFENQNKDLQDKYDVLKNQTTTFVMNNEELNEQLKELIEKNNDLLAQTNVLKVQLQVKHVVIDTHVECQEKYVKPEAERYEYMIRYSAYFDNDKQHRKQIADQKILKEIGFKNLSYFEKAKDLRPTLFDEKVIGLGYTPMFLTHSDEALELEKFKRLRENKIEFTYDYGNLNASYQTSSLKPYVPNVILKKIIIDLEDEVVNLLEKEKVNLETIEFLKSKGFESSENVSFESENQTENDCLVVEKEYDKEENPKIIIDLEDEVVNLLEKEKVNLEITESLKSKDLDTFSSVRRPKNNDVIWKKKGSSNTCNVGLSAVSVLTLNKNVKRYSRKDLLACNNSHLEETTSASVCNDAMNVSCNPWMCDLLDDYNFFIFDDVNVRISPVSKMPFRKKPFDSMNSIPINVITIGDEASTSHNVFNERLKDAYFDASTLFHDPSNVQTFYQPYPHEKKWTKDHPLHKIIGDPKSSVCTRGQLANSCLFLCLLSSIEPANVAEALKDADWVCAMQEELDQFARLKV
nr:hypothetical protein [Tanacetum cinerariifolium]